MKRYEFPKSWKLDIKTKEELASRLGMAVGELNRLERSIPRNYRYAIIRQERAGEWKIRELWIPSDDLKEVQRLILKNLLSFQFPDYIHGGVSKKSIITNAKTHQVRKWVACLDIKDFYPTVHFSRVQQVFLDLECSPLVASTLTHFVSFQHQLPQGAPTSPTISNLILYNFDLRVARLCHQIKRLKFSRYFDDVAISGEENLEGVCLKVVKIAAQEGFYIHAKGPKKFVVYGRGIPQVVTGIVVNGKRLRASPEFLERLEQVLDELTGRAPKVHNPAKIIDQTLGMIAFLKSIEPPRAKELNARFNKIDLRRYGH